MARWWDVATKTRNSPFCSRKSRSGQLAHRYGVAMALDGDRGSGAEYFPQRTRPDARVSGLQIHDVFGAHVRLDGREISRLVQRNRTAGSRGALGSHRGHVGRAGFEYARRRVSGAANPRRQTLFSRQIRDRCENWVESGFVRLQLATAADLQKIRDRLFRDAKADVGARIYHFPLQTLLVGVARWQPHSDL